MFGNLGQRQHPFADGRVENRDLAAADFGQHHEVVQIPMQDAGQFQLAQILHIQSQRTGGEAQLLGDLDQMRKLGALER